VDRTLEKSASPLPANGPKKACVGMDRDKLKAIVCRPVFTDSKSVVDGLRRQAKEHSVGLSARKLDSGGWLLGRPVGRKRRRAT
jgi:hypothetical protein